MGLWVEKLCFTSMSTWYKAGLKWAGTHQYSYILVLSTACLHFFLETRHFSSPPTHRSFRLSKSAAD